MCILLVLYTWKGNPGHLVCRVCTSDSDMRFVVNRAILETKPPVATTCIRTLNLVFACHILTQKSV